MFYGWPGRAGSGRVGPGRAGPGRVAKNSIVIRVYLLGIPVVNEVIFFYKNHYKIPLRGNKIRIISCSLVQACGGEDGEDGEDGEIYTI